MQVILVPSALYLIRGQFVNHRMSLMHFLRQTDEWRDRYLAEQKLTSRLP